MLRSNPRGYHPEVSSAAYIDSTAIVCGRVVIGSNVYVGPYAVIRADELNEQGDMEPVIIGNDSNIQDGVVIHSKSGAAVTIGERTSIAHRAIVHGPCNVGNDVFIGFNSVIFNCKVGDGCVVRHNAVVDGCDLPERRHVPSTARIDSGFDVSTIAEVEQEYASFSQSVIDANKYLVQGYSKLRNEF